MKIKIPYERRIHENEAIPKGYGAAWIDHYSLDVICFPIPLNIILGGCRSLYYWAEGMIWIARWESKLLNYKYRWYLKGRESGAAAERLLWLRAMEDGDITRSSKKYLPFTKRP